MSEPFNPYHMWLGIPPEEQPANHYRLLGVPLFEVNGDVISNAADQRMAHLRTLQVGKNSALSQTVLNEVSAASACLLVPEKKQAYDQALRQKIAAAAPKPAPAPVAKRVLPQAAPRPAAVPTPQAQNTAVAPSPSPSTPAMNFVTTAPQRSSQTAKPKGLSASAIVMAGIAGIALVLGAVIVVISMSQSPQQIAKETGPKKVASPKIDVPTKVQESPSTPPAVTKNVVQPPAPAVETPQPIAPEAPAENTPTIPTPLPTVPVAPTPTIPAPTPVEPPSIPVVPAVKPEPQPTTPDPPPAAVAPEQPASKLPSEEQMAGARKLLVDTFGTEAKNATDAESKRALASKLNKLADETLDDPAARYVLVDNARKLFIGAGDVTAAIVSAHKLAEWFELDAAAAAELRQATLTSLADASLLSNATREELADRIQDELNASILHNRLAAADEYSLLGVKVTRGLKEPERKRIANQQRTMVIKLKGEHVKFEQARATLKDDPANSAANVIVGKYLCTVLNDWKQGLVHLAASGDATLADVVAADESAQAESENQVDLQFTAADTWFNWSEHAKPADRELLALAKSRAHHWYHTAAPKLTGLNKIKAEKRVAELAPADAPAPRPAAPSPAAVADTTASKKATKSTTKSRVPVPFEMATTSVCEVLQGKKAPTSLFAQAEHFAAPIGDGRKGANGFVLTAGEAWKKQGTTWKFKYFFNGSANGLKIAHPFQNGQLLVSLNHEPKGFGLNAGGNWTDVGWRMAGQRKIPFEITPEGQAIFPLALDTEHEIVSQLTADGRYGMFINKTLVAFSVLPNGITLPLDLRIPEDGPNIKAGSLFSGGSMPRALKPGEALIMVGPLDNGINKLTGIEFGPKPGE